MIYVVMVKGDDDILATMETELTPTAEMLKDGFDDRSVIWSIPDSDFLFYALH